MSSAIKSIKNDLKKLHAGKGRWIVLYDDEPEPVPLYPNDTVIRMSGRFRNV